VSICSYIAEDQESKATLEARIAIFNQSAQIFVQESTEKNVPLQLQNNLSYNLSIVPDPESHPMECSQKQQSYHEHDQIE
jgi:hypothetical protein